MLLLKQEIKMTQVGLAEAKMKELRNLELPEHTKFALDQSIH